MPRSWYGEEPAPGYDFDSEEDALAFCEWALLFGLTFEYEDKSVSVPEGVGFAQSSLNRLVDEWEETRR